jgi:hypothetical protein
MLPKPEHLSDTYASQFSDPSVVAGSRTLGRPASLAPVRR